MAKTILKFIGGLNKDRIGANCQVIEHTDEKNTKSGIMIDLGSLFTPYGTEFSAVYPDVEDYFDYAESKSKEPQRAKKHVDALFITHTHQDHIGALIDLVKMGYRLPPIYTSEYTKHCIRLSFHKAGMLPPEIQTIKEGDKFNFSNMEIKPFDVAHSAVDPFGFQVRTFKDNKPYTKIIDPGDFLITEEMPIGHATNQKTFLKMLKDDPALNTVVELDSTSTGPNKRKRIDFKQAVENTHQVCLSHPNCSVIVSPVIAYSWNNVAIDLEVARELGTKVYFDGAGLEIPKNALKLCGYDQYDDVMYHGTLQEYMADKKIKIKYLVCTGPFGQGWEEYKNNIGETPYSPIWMSSLVKMALDLHPYARVSKDYLFIFRQPDIESITQGSVKEIIHCLARQGASVVATPNGGDQRYVKTVPMQSSGHNDAEQTVSWIKAIKSVVPNVIVFPIHGTTEQRQATADLMASIGVKCYMSSNGDSYEILPNGVRQKETKGKAENFLAVKKVYYGTEGRTDIPPEGITQYWRVNENYERIELLKEVSNVVQTAPKSHSSGKHIDVEAYESLPQGEKISPYTHKPSLRKVKKAGKKRTFPQKQRD